MYIRNEEILGWAKFSPSLLSSLWKFETEGNTFFWFTVQCELFIFRENLKNKHLTLRSHEAKTLEKCLFSDSQNALFKIATKQYLCDIWWFDEGEGVQILTLDFDVWFWHSILMLDFVAWDFDAWFWHYILTLDFDAWFWHLILSINFEYWFWHLILTLDFDPWFWCLILMLDFDA